MISNFGFLKVLTKFCLVKFSRHSKNPSLFCLKKKKKKKKKNIS